MWDEQTKRVGLGLRGRGGLERFVVKCSNDQAESLHVLALVEISHKSNVTFAVASHKPLTVKTLSTAPRE